jgi:putative copper export protein/mono/diheme cytochrome c family protein
MFYVRAIHFAATIQVAGVAFFVVLVAEPALRGAASGGDRAVAVRRRLLWIAWVGLALCVISGAAWLILTAQSMSGEPLGEVFSHGVLWTVLSDTNFGRDWLLRFAFACLLAAAFVPFQSGKRFTSGSTKAALVVLAACLAGTLVWAGHAAGGEGAEAIIHPAADFLHLIAAAAWVGMLVPLAVLLRAAGQDSETIACARAATVRFSTWGTVSVGTLLVTGSINTWYLAGSVPALIGTHYGRLLLAKVALFLGMVAIAAVNRLRLTPRLVKNAGMAVTENAMRQLRRNVTLEIVVGAAIIVIVAVLGTNPPSLHQEPVWPFSFRFNSAALADPKLRDSLLPPLGAIAAGIALVAAGCALRRLRWPAIAVGIAVIVYVIPSLKSLTTEAYPTTYYVSPVPFTAQSIAAGRRLFAAHCASCHGADGRGDGPAATSMTTKPADLTAEHIYGHSDGDLFWWISNGIGGVMPPFGPMLDDDARWNVINFIHANADAARFRRYAAGTSAAFPSPEFSASCPDGSAITIDQAAGRIVHVVAAGAGAGDRLRQLALNDMQRHIDMVVITANWTPEKPGPFCLTQDPTVVGAFALYAGKDAQELAGAAFLIDRGGNLRSMWNSALDPGSSELDTLKERVEGLRIPPVVIRPAGAHSHVH